MDDKLLTTDQIADILQVHTYTVLKYIKSGKLRGVKLGRVWRVRSSEVDRFIEERSHHPVSKHPSNQKENQTKDETGQHDEDHYVID